MDRRREKKVLLMGDASCGKSSMRAVIFKNTLPDLTSRLTPTHRYESEHFRFFGAIALDLWECGGQRSYTDYYLSDNGQNTVFAHVSAMIFAFEVTKLDAANRPPEVTMQYYTRCVEALHRHSPNVPVIVLIQKMDLVHPDRRDADFNAWIEAIKEYSADTPFTAFGTSIYEDTLYRAWSAVVQNLVPNIDDLTKSLNIFSKSCGAVETVIFEKTTFLLVARSAVEEPRNESLVAVYAGSQQEHVEEAVIQAPTEEDHDSLQPEVNRFEKIIKLIKSFQISTRNYSAEPFEALRMDISTFTLVLDQLTPTSYVLVIASSNEPRISPEAITYNINRVRSHFESLQGTSK